MTRSPKAYGLRLGVRLLEKRAQSFFPMTVPEEEMLDEDRLLQMINAFRGGQAQPAAEKSTKVLSVPE